MSAQQSFQVAGVDGCKAGWFVVIALASDAPYVFKLKSFFVAVSFAQLLSKTSDCKLVCVDIPIGLSDEKQRECDILARKLLGRPRADSIFPPPIRPCLSATDYKTACKISFEHTGKKLSKQSFFIMDKIRQVDDLMTPELQNRVREIHPEISFWAVAGKKPMRYSKRKLVGQNERIKLLSTIFSNPKEILAKARKPGEVAPDDILDALIAAWTAYQAIIGRATTLPENPKLDSKGLRMEILYPACYNW